jgi:hypothetical protein
MMDNNNDNDKTSDDDAIRKEVNEEFSELAEAEKHQIALEFSTNIIAAHKYCLKNVIHTGKGFDCEIIYIPRPKDPEDDIHFTKRFRVRLTSKSAFIECIEIRDGWGGHGKLWLGQQDIDPDTAQELINQAMAIAATLANIPVTEAGREKFLAELMAEAAEEEGDDGEKVVRQQEHNHELDLAIAELCADVEVEFYEPRML